MESDLADIAPPDAARIIGTEAQRRAPKRTGRLASSFGSSTGRGVVSVSFGVEYAGPINFGVGPRIGLRGPHNIPATRFLTGAVSDREALWIETYKDAAQNAADKVKGV
jgi:phage gpG-like protein